MPDPGDYITYVIRANAAGQVVSRSCGIRALEQGGYVSDRIEEGREYLRRGSEETHVPAGSGALMELLTREETAMLAKFLQTDRFQRWIRSL